MGEAIETLGGGSRVMMHTDPTFELNTATKGIIEA